MKCPSCGKDNPASEQYCLDCGSDLHAAPAAVSGAAAVAPAASASTTQSYAMSDEEFQRMLNTPPATTTCPHCGAAAPAGGTFCDTCGESLSATPANTAASAGAAPAAAAPGANGGSAAVFAPAPSAAAGQPAETSQAPTQSIAPPAAGGPALAAAGSGVSFEYAGPTSSGTCVMAGDEVHVGRRDADAGIYPELDFDGNDLVTDAGERVHAVSRRHARIFRAGGALKFEDLGSTNGSTLNGAAVLAHDPQPLKDGDRIVLGRTCRITVHAP